MNILSKSIFAGIILSIAGFASINLMSPVNGLIFSFGLNLIVLLKLNLFTGDILKIRNGLTKEFVLHCIKVYLGNFIGCFIFAKLLLSCNYDLSKLNTIAVYKSNIDFLPALYKGIMCNIMVCTASYLASKTDSVINKFVSIVIPITLFIVCGFEHSIANMFFFSTSNVSYINLIPVTIGNILGGIFVVRMTEHLEDKGDLYEQNNKLK